MGLYGLIGFCFFMFVLFVLGIVGFLLLYKHYSDAKYYIRALGILDTLNDLKSDINVLHSSIEFFDKKFSEEIDRLDTDDDRTLGLLYSLKKELACKGLISIKELKK